MPTLWIDRYGGGKSVQCYKLVLQTPYAPGITDEQLDARLKADISDIFPDIGIIGHNECNRRAFDADESIPFGCQKRINWSKGTCLVELLMFEEFTGFPVLSDDPESVYEPEPVENYDVEEWLQAGNYS